eukprot:2489672-Prymnesium_polylepis.1
MAEATLAPVAVATRPSACAARSPPASRIKPSHASPATPTACAKVLTASSNEGTLGGVHCAVPPSVAASYSALVSGSDRHSYAPASACDGRRAHRRSSWAGREQRMEGAAGPRVLCPGVSER